MFCDCVCEPDSQEICSENNEEKEKEKEKEKDKAREEQFNRKLEEVHLLHFIIDIEANR